MLDNDIAVAQTLLKESIAADISHGMSVTDKTLRFAPAPNTAYLNSRVMVQLLLLLLLLLSS